jgi:C6 transcription factor Pro1
VAQGGYPHVGACATATDQSSLSSMQDNRNVLAVRDRIKTHLAAQGMIKGHSGAGPRNAEREPPVLRLHDEYPNSTSSSPPTPTLSISSSDDNRRPGLSISSMRDDSYHLQPSLEPFPSGAYSASLPGPRQLMSTSPGLMPRMQELSPNSPQPSRGPNYPNDIMLPPYNITTSASTSIDQDCKTYRY